MVDKIKELALIFLICVSLVDIIFTLYRKHLHQVNLSIFFTYSQLHTVNSQSYIAATALSLTSNYIAVSKKYLTNTQIIFSFAESKFIELYCLKCLKWLLFAAQRYMHSAADAMVRCPSVRHVRAHVDTNRHILNFFTLVTHHCSIFVRKLWRSSDSPPQFRRQT